jgi:hypothetical protein
MGKNKYIRFERFKEHLLPHFYRRVGTDMIDINEEGRLIVVFRRDNSGNRRLWFHFYPIGNLVYLPGGQWIREKAIDYVLQEMFGQVIQEWVNLIYPEGYPALKDPSKKQSSKEKEAIVEKLSIVGDRFQENNLKSKYTLAYAKMVRCLNEAGIPYMMELPVVIKQSAEYNFEPKLFLIDLYIPPPFSFIIEVDGGYHQTPQQIKYDQHRDLSLRGKGLGYTIRIANETIIDKDFDVMKHLRKYAVFKAAVKRATDQRSKQDF